jgi:beta-lactamase class D
MQQAHRTSANPSCTSESRRSETYPQEDVPGRRTRTAKKREHKDIILAIATVKAQVWILGERLNDIRLEATRSYVTREAVGNIERKVIEEIQRMEKRLEAQLDRIMELVSKLAGHRLPASAPADAQIA